MHTGLVPTVVGTTHTQTYDYSLILQKHHTTVIIVLIDIIKYMSDLSVESLETDFLMEDRRFLIVHPQQRGR